MEMFYTRDNRWALGKGVRAMHCTACDAELILAKWSRRTRRLFVALSTTLLFARDAISECAE